MWPPDRQAFEDYWNEAVKGIRMDDVTRAYLQDFAGLGFLWWPLPHLFGGFHRILTVGSLSEEFREELGLPWSRRAELVYEAKIGRASGRERVCQYVSISGVAVSLKKKK